MIVPDGEWHRYRNSDLTKYSLRLAPQYVREPVCNLQWYHRNKSSNRHTMRIHGRMQLRMKPPFAPAT